MSFSHNVLQRYVWSYIVWHPLCRTAQSALHFTPWRHTCSCRHKFGFFGKHSVMLPLLYEDFTRESPAFYHIMLADNVVCRLYSVGALLRNYMTTVIICFNIQYAVCRGPVEQQCIRYLTSNVFGNGSTGTDSSACFFCQISSGELSTASAEGTARIMVVGGQRRLDDVS